MAWLTWVRAVARLRKKGGADLVVGHALTDEREDFTLSLGEDGEPLFGGLVRGSSCGELGDEATGDTGREQSFSGSDDADAVKEFGRSGVFEQEPAGACL
jgi:hypothetical protein